MHAIVLTDNRDVDLGALNGQIPFPLLPIAGKRIVLHVLEQLHRSGIRSATVISRNSHSELKAAIDTEPLLGMSVNFTRQMHDLRHLDDDILLIGTNQLIDFNWKKLRAMHSNSHGVTKLTATRSEIIGFVFHSHIAERVPDIWGNFKDFGSNTVSIGSPKILKINTLSNYQTANFEILHGNCKHLHAAGRERSPHLYTAPKAHISHKVMKGQYTYIGMYSRVHDRASLYGDVVIGDDVFIDKGARISNSIIMDGTYIGAMTSIDDAIVNGNMLIKVKSGLCLTIDDPLLLSKAI